MPRQGPGVAMPFDMVGGVKIPHVIVGYQTRDVVGEPPQRRTRQTVTTGLFLSAGRLTTAMAEADGG